MNDEERNKEWLIPEEMLEDIILRDYSKGKLGDKLVDREKIMKDNDPIKHLLHKVLNTKNLFKTAVVIDRMKWRAEGEKILDEISKHVDKMPLVGIDSEYLGGIDTLVVLTDAGPKGYAFRMGYPKQVIDLILDPSLIVTGDPSGLKATLGQTPPNF